MSLQPQTVMTVCINISSLRASLTYLPPNVQNVRVGIMVVYVFVIGMSLELYTRFFLIGEEGIYLTHFDGQSSKTKLGRN